MNGALHEACGVVGVIAEEAARLAFFGLFALQHRGQESAGIATLDTGSIHLHKDVGLVSQVFRGRTCRPLSATSRSATRATRRREDRARATPSRF